MPRRRHTEQHLIARVGWLRAAVLGANDGILSTASLILGVATASHSRSGILVAGISGAGGGGAFHGGGRICLGFVQADVERAELAQERRELQDDSPAELAELTQIYVKRGLDHELAHQVAVQLTHKDALAAHARDELGITEEFIARPLQAALASAISFSGGAVLPLIVGIVTPMSWAVPAIYGASLIFLIALGAIGARTGGAPAGAGAFRVGFWGAIAMAVTAGIGTLFHVQL